MSEKFSGGGGASGFAHDLITVTLQQKAFHLTLLKALSPSLYLVSTLFYVM